MNYKKSILLGALMVLSVHLIGCGKSETKSEPTVSQDTIFTMYNNVDLSQSKDIIDDILKVSPGENSMMENTYDYLDKESGYGVTVIYNADNQAIAKTVIYPSHQDIAPFCDKAVNKNQVDQLTNGMSYDQAKELLGSDGVEVNATELEFEDNAISKMYRWINEDGTGIQLVIGTDSTIVNTMYID